ncbi:thioredoxin-like protein [Pyrenochaeta sp. MPI-SDFR-AT-0127]|nr:thioredoxin-like protein [Pyrenochaeta sp. MPI-SDFR-AT-0127]
MPYESTITFTLDTICPWTYLGFLRLSKALVSYRQSHPSSPASFTLKLAPYQLYPDFSQDGEDKHEWYKNEKYDGSERRMEMYSAHMGNLGKTEGVEFDFGGGMIANTLHAHRILQWLQNNKSPEAALKALKSLYEQYFTQRRHPSSPDTLLKACVAAGLSEEEAKKLVEYESDELMETKMAIREQTGNGVDSVPYVVFEGRKRDFTLIGAKEVAEYEKAMAQVAKECT